MKKILPSLAVATVALAFSASLFPAHAAPKNGNGNGNGNGKGQPNKTTELPSEPSTSPISSTPESSSTESSSMESSPIALLNDSLGCTASGMGYTDCAGSFSLGAGENDVTNGGDSNIAVKLLNEQDLFGAADWTFGSKYDGGWEGSNANGMSVTGLGSTSGTFEFSNIDLASTDLAISLKSAKGFSLYYFKAGSITDGSINWDTLGTSVNGKGSAQGLSHISYFTRIGEVKSSRIRKVPEPTVMSGLLLVGAAAVVRRRKQRSETDA